MTASEEISTATQLIRTRELGLRKKHPFGLKFTYWDADDLTFQMKQEGTQFIVIERKTGDIVVSCDPNYKNPEKFTVRPDQLIEMFVMSAGAVDKMLLVHKTFVEEGGINMNGLTAPGIDEMEKFCRGLDKTICDIAWDLKKRLNMDNIFNKLWIEMGGETTRKDDIVAKRMLYISELGVEYRKDKAKWHPEMKTVGLV